MLTIGEKVVYPNQGPCLIDCLIERVVNGEVTLFYRLALLDEAGGELFIPADKAQTIGIRLLLDRSEIPKLLRHLRKSTKSDKNWKQRALDNLKLLTSGSAFDLAEVIASLSELRERKGLSPAELRTLEKARRLLVCEMAEVLGKTKSAAEQQLDDTLKTRRCVI
jgi:CarD family transcriptional regulator, regulator of rRNA transcription